MNNIESLSTTELRKLERKIQDDTKWQPLYKSILIRGIRAEINGRFDSETVHDCGAPDSPFVLR